MFNKEISYFKTAAPQKIHILGSIGSGKTTLAKNLSNQLAIPHYELDNMVWIRSESGDIRRTQQERDERLKATVAKDAWIIEGAQHSWVSVSFERADLILFLDTSYQRRKVRILKRYMKQKIGIEKANYQPSLEILRDLYRYNTIFEFKTKPLILDILASFHQKTVIVKNPESILNNLK